MKGYQKERASVNGSIEVMDMGPLVELASEGLLALSVQVGLEVLRQMLAVDVTALAGAKGRHNPDRSAYRHGTETTRVVMGGQKVSVKRPRVRSKEGSELQLPTLSVFQNEDPLNRVLLQRLLCGVSTRKYSRTLDESLEDAACVSKSEASRRFAAAMEARMDEFFKRRIEVSFPGMMIDGLELGKMTIIAAMGIDSEGRKRILGLAEGGAENSEVVKALLADMVERGLDASEPRLYILDGGKALHKAVKDTFGNKAVIQRCQVHKKRNVLSYLPESEQANVSLAMTTAYREFEYDKAKASLELLTDNLVYRLFDKRSCLTDNRGKRVRRKHERADNGQGFGDEGGAEAAERAGDGGGFGETYRRRAAERDGPDELLRMAAAVSDARSGRAERPASDHEEPAQRDDAGNRGEDH
jgi:transposase-like protein